MTDESKSPPQVAGSSPGTRAGKLAKAAKMREEAKQLRARAAGIERREGIAKRTELSRDYRLVGTIVMERALKSPVLARTILDAIEQWPLSHRDREHLAREGSALSWLQGIAKHGA